MNKKLSTFYVTFGSDTAFPYPNGYMTIKAENEYHAREMFRAFFKNREGSDCLNFSFIHDENSWNKNCLIYYEDTRKSASIYMDSMSIYLIDTVHTEFKDIFSLYQAGFDVVSKDLYEKVKDYREDVMSSKLYRRLMEYQEDMEEPINKNIEKEKKEEPDILQVDGYMDGIRLPNLYTATYILSDSYIDFVNGEINNMEWKDKSDQLIMRVRLRDESMNENIYISIKASDVCKFYDNYILDFNKLHANQIFADLCHDKHYFNDRIEDMVETYSELPSPLEEDNEYDER